MHVATRYASLAFSLSDLLPYFSSSLFIDSLRQRRQQIHTAANNSLLRQDKRERTSIYSAAADAGSHRGATRSSLLWFPGSCHRYAPITPAPDSRASVWRSLPARTSTRVRQLFSSKTALRKTRATLNFEIFQLFTFFCGFDELLLVN